MDMAQDLRRWTPSLLKPQDHLLEFCALTGTSLQQILDYPQNKTLAAYRSPSNGPEFTPSDLAFKPGNLVYLPSLLVDGQSIAAGSSNTFAGQTTSLKISIRLKGVTRQERPNADLEEPVPDLAGLKFSVTRKGDANDESDDDLKAWFEKSRDLKSGDPLLMGGLVSTRAATFIVKPAAASGDFWADPEVRVEVATRLYGAFAAAEVRLTGSSNPAATPTNFRRARLVKISPFERIFEIEYYLPRVNRALRAWHSARNEIEEGRNLYGAGKKWRQDAYDKDSIVVTRYLKFIKGLPNIALNEHTGKPGPTNWCGIFQGYNYKQAGLDMTRALAWVWPPRQVDRRHPPPPPDPNTVYADGDRVTATPKLFWYWDKHPNSKTILCRFPYSQKNPRFPVPKTEEACREWLRSNFHPWGPSPGDLILFNVGGQRNAHIGMVGGYDPKTYELITYQGNGGSGDVGGSWRFDLSSPSRPGLASIYAIGKLPEGADGDSFLAGNPAASLSSVDRSSPDPVDL